MAKGPRGEKRPADPNKRAFTIVQIATGERRDIGHSPGNAKAGKVGGKARAKALLPEERKKIAQKAAKARWDK